MTRIPITTLELFPELDYQLLSLLRDLSPADWESPTIAGKWRVKEVAAHLLDGNLRGISLYRDHYSLSQDRPLDSYADILTFLNGLNADWVKAMQRVSPELIIALLELTGPQYFNELVKLDPLGPAIYPVSWAGDLESPNWFHIAREYTEKWHHQQQIREAVNRPGILNRKFYYPVLDTFMQALPHAYRKFTALPGTCIQISISGHAGGDWFLHFIKQWTLIPNPDQQPHAVLRIPPEAAWKLFTKSWRAGQVQPYIKMEGDSELLQPALEMITVMA